MADHVFICYARSDQEFVLQLAKNLKDRGVPVWLDQWDVVPGADWDQSIDEALYECAQMLIVLSPTSIKSREVRGELRIALDEHKPIIPVLFKKCFLPRQLRVVHYVDFTSVQPDDSVELNKILSVLNVQKAKEESKRKGAEEERKRKEAEIKQNAEAKRKAEEDRKLRVAEEAKRKAEEELKRQDAEVEVKRKEAQAEIVDEQPPIVSPKARRQKRLNLGIVAIAAVVVLSVMGWLLFSKPKYAKTINNSIGMEFKFIPAESFMMGSKISPKETAQKYGGEAKWFKTEHPQHKVIINESFYLQSTEVTQGQWATVMGDNPSHFKACGDGCPVENISWDDAHKFIKKLNEIEGSEAHRLPTEAEWEYAGRANTDTLFSFGNDEDKLTQYAWYLKNSEGRTHRVGTKKPNAWGLHDMYGNVYEIVKDDWHKNYNGAPYDGSAWMAEPRGVDRVIRGGSWNYDAQYCRSAFRRDYPHDYRIRYLGFRLARSVALGP